MVWLQSSGASKGKRTFCIPHENSCTARSLWAAWFIAGEPWMTPDKVTLPNSWLPPPRPIPSPFPTRVEALTRPRSPHHGDHHTVTSGSLQYFLTSDRHVHISAFHNLDLCFFFFVLLPPIHLMPCSFYYTQSVLHQCTRTLSLICENLLFCFVRFGCVTTRGGKDSAITTRFVLQFLPRLCTF